MNITDIQVLFNKLRCPQCKNATIDVALRCDLGYGECIAAATCQTCHMVYDVSTEKKRLEEGREKYPTLECPDCQAKDVRMEFRCELESKKCFYVLRCKKCDTPFHSDHG